MTASIAQKRRQLIRLARPKPVATAAPPKRCQVLAEALASGRVAPERVAELLGIRTEDVAAIAAGRVGLAATAWRRLLQELEA